MDEAVDVMRAHGASPMFGDGVHPNIFGNFVMAVSLLEHLGISVTRYRQVETEFVRHGPRHKPLFEFRVQLPDKVVRKILQRLVEVAKVGRRAGRALVTMPPSAATR